MTTRGALLAVGFLDDGGSVLFVCGTLFARRRVVPGSTAAIPV